MKRNRNSVWATVRKLSMLSAFHLLLHCKSNVSYYGQVSILSFKRVKNRLLKTGMKG